VSTLIQFFLGKSIEPTLGINQCRASNGGICMNRNFDFPVIVNGQFSIELGKHISEMKFETVSEISFRNAHDLLDCEEFTDEIFSFDAIGLPESLQGILIGELVEVEFIVERLTNPLGWIKPVIVVPKEPINGILFDGGLVHGHVAPPSDRKILQVHAFVN